MCYRYTLKNLSQTADYYQDCVEAALAQWQPRYNVTLTDRMPVITRRNRTTLETMQFGFTLPRRTATERPRPLGNARAETLLVKPSFCAAVRAHRCLVPADGFYEWEKIGRTRQPHYFQRTAGRLFFFAGLWTPAQADTPTAFCIVTTTPNALLQPLHDRMPVMLAGPAAQAWLDDQPLTPAHLATLCQPFPAGEMISHPVSPRVNRAGYESPDCVLAQASPSAEPELFDHCSFR